MIQIQTMQQQMGEPSSNHHHHDELSPSPSFSSYSSETLAEIAARVIEELRRDPHSTATANHDDDAFFHPWQNDNDEDEATTQNDNDGGDDGDDFEFAFVTNTSPVSADDIFSNGQIRPMYPIFGAPPAALNDVVNCDRESVAPAARRRRLPLRMLMFEEGETASCSSSTDESSVDLEGAAEGSYCVWNPNSVATEAKKSSSVGSSGSKRWKLRNLLLSRSHSNGKDDSKPVAANGGSGEDDGGGKKGKDGEQGKRKSFLPNRPEFVGLFANVNGLGRNLNPF